MMGARWEGAIATTGGYRRLASNVHQSASCRCLCRVNHPGSVPVCDDIDPHNPARAFGHSDPCPSCEAAIWRAR